MNKERYNQIIYEAWKKYLDETRFTSNPEWLEPVEVVNVKTLEKNWGARQYHRNDFINKCKTDAKFSERWGLKIEERELSLEEQIDIGLKRGFDAFDLDIASGNGKLSEYNIPTKLITVTYNNEIIEVYEN